MAKIATLPDQQTSITNLAARHDAWSAGQSYERYMGRWSREIAGRYLDWLEAPVQADWLDIGCGTGALSQTILGKCDPRSVTGIDPSEGFVAHAAETTGDERAHFATGSAESLPLRDHAADVVTSALMLNFVSDRIKALTEMVRVARPGGLVSFYVWDYPGGSPGFIDAFWKAAAELDEHAADLDEKNRFPFCTPDGLTDLCRSAGWNKPDAVAIEIPTRFLTFEDFWHSFSLGAGPAPGYAAKLSGEAREALKKRLRLNIGDAGPIALKARAWAVKAMAP
ncbi:MAG: class I SAM-dependent methyltransferase [Notoacmeibacter sp.]|nr:class I SAM-dependent methyltransferase [Notoacmeibacter sp.]MCC0031644.1 class I SAM-dependent methyltransferase [Brucellaceae bacterium]